MSPNMISNGITKGLNYVFNTKPSLSVAKKYENNKPGIAELVAVSSIVLKDGLGCYYYVTQSLNNEKIPKEKRGFVAALDMTNGVLMISTQILMTLGMAKLQGKIFDKKIASKYFPRVARKMSAVVQKCEDYASKTRYYESFENAKKTCSESFKFITSLVAATIVAKRIIVPFIATPFAQWARTNILHDESDPKNPQKTTNAKKPQEHHLSGVYKDFLDDKLCDFLAIKQA